MGYMDRNKFQFCKVSLGTSSPLVQLNVLPHTFFKSMSPFSKNALNANTCTYAAFFTYTKSTRGGSTDRGVGTWDIPPLSNGPISMLSGVPSEKVPYMPGIRMAQVRK